MRLPTPANDNVKPAKLLRYCELNETRGITFTRRHLYPLENERKFPRRVPPGDTGAVLSAGAMSASGEKQTSDRDWARSANASTANMR
jgi:hypothetical protein